MEENKKNHILKIDVLRGIAIIAVFLYHAQYCKFPEFLTPHYNTNGTIIITNLKDLLLNFSPISFGWTGVELFLIISGFLIHLGYLSNKDKFNIKTFYSKRF